MSAMSTAVVFPVDRRTINGPLKGTSNSLMLSVLGNPRGNYDETCRHPTNSSLLQHIVSGKDVGPFKVTGLKPAVDTLADIFADVKREQPRIYEQLGNAGMLCCRFVRGSRSAISNHSWGTAIDLTLEGKLDVRGDGKVQRGLLDIYKIFNRHKFFWGAAFSTEDSMHFEVSEQLLRKWVSDGLFSKSKIAIDGLTVGDRGTDVEELQEKLNLKLGLDVDVDGIFGAQTRAAVTELQRQNNIPITGIADAKTLALL